MIRCRLTFRAAFLTCLAGLLQIASANLGGTTSSFTMDVSSDPGAKAGAEGGYEAGLTYFYKYDFNPAAATGDFVILFDDFGGNLLFDEFDNASATGPYTITLDDTDVAGDPPSLGVFFDLNPSFVDLSGLTPPVPPLNPVNNDLPSGFEGLPVTFDIQFIPLDGGPGIPDLDTTLSGGDSVSGILYTPLPVSFESTAALMLFTGLIVVLKRKRLQLD